MMRLAPSAQARLEKFMREHVGDPALQLPRIRMHSGGFSRWLTKSLKVGAVTVGRHIFVAPVMVGRDEEGRLTFPGWLLAHEALHVLQFEREGYVRFLIKYLRDYFGALKAIGGWDAGARMAAYLAIGHECEAREAEAAYHSWTGGPLAAEPSGVEETRAEARDDTAAGPAV